jgi:DNA-binding GntR family transcriptional regulator
MNSRFDNSPNQRRSSAEPASVDKEKPLTIAEQIAVQLARDILDGRLETGSKISEYQLADRFEVSRGPVREAVSILEQNCLVRSSPRLSARVNAVNRSEVGQLFEVRRELLGMIASYAARNITDEELEDLRNGINRLAHNLSERPNDLVGFFKASQGCWRILARASKARTLTHINSMVTSSPIWHIAICDRLGEDAEMAFGPVILTHWEALYDAIGRRDADQTSEQARTISATTWKRISKYFEEDSV